MVVILREDIIDHFGSFVDLWPRACGPMVQMRLFVASCCRTKKCFPDSTDILDIFTMICIYEGNKN